MKARVYEQKILAMDLNERATQYKIMDREVETNKGIYQSLLERTKEIESMAGVSSSNINIVNNALLPVFPFKPNVKMNLLLAMITGLIGGIGCAFLVEYFSRYNNGSGRDPRSFSDSHSRCGSSCQRKRLSRCRGPSPPILILVCPRHCEPLRHPFSFQVSVARPKASF